MSCKLRDTTVMATVTVDQVSSCSLLQFEPGELNAGESSCMSRIPVWTEDGSD